MSNPLRDELQRYPRTGRFLLGRLRDVLSEDEKQLVEDLIEREETLPAGAMIARRGADCSISTILIDGFARRVIERNGYPHIVGLQVPGDFVDLHGFALKRLDHDLYTLGPARVGRVSHVRLREVLQDRPHLARLLWFSTLLDSAIHREWILKLEDLSAAERVAHLFCEICHRLELVGMGSRTGFSLPLTQAQLAGMCGTTTVHMSRALRRLREATGVTFRHGELKCGDPDELMRYCEYDSSYLYGPGELRFSGPDYKD